MQCGEDARQLRPREGGQRRVARLCRQLREVAHVGIARVRGSRGEMRGERCEKFRVAIRRVAIARGEGACGSLRHEARDLAPER